MVGPPSRKAKWATGQIGLESDEEVGSGDADTSALDHRRSQGDDIWPAVSKMTGAEHVAELAYIKMKKEHQFLDSLK